MSILKSLFAVSLPMVIALSLFNVSVLTSFKLTKQLNNSRSPAVYSVNR